jgi:hypothetical protein
VLFTPGRRRWCRRAEDAERHAVVDRHGPLMRTLVVAILLLTILDGLLTLLLIDSHHDEANPLMAQLLARGAIWFVFGKFALTALCLPPLLIWKNHRLFGTPFRVKYLIPLIVVLYLALTSVQVWFVGGPYGPRGLTAALAGGVRP